jgi:(p)ppGpp synthase/HD superfamily hydrolase
MHQHFSEIAESNMLPRLMLTRPRVPELIVGLPHTQRALAYAERAHTGQVRHADGAPYIQHPNEVAALLYYAGASDHVIAAGALHDTIEKTTTRVSDLERRFGTRIARLVCAVSDDEDIVDYDERKAAAREQAAAAGDEALMILAADKISKVGELQIETTAAHRQHAALATPSRQRRLVHYGECLHLLEQRLPHSPLVAQLRAEIERLPDALTRHAVLSTAAV